VRGRGLRCPGHIRLLHMRGPAGRSFASFGGPLRAGRKRPPFTIAPIPQARLLAVSKKASGDLLRDPRTVWFGSEGEELLKRRATMRLVTRSRSQCCWMQASTVSKAFFNSARMLLVWWPSRATAAQFGFLLSVNLSNVRCPSSSFGCDRLLDGVTDSC
jgi:hypothetical protein